MTRAIAVTSWAPAPWIIANRQTRAACSRVHIGTFNAVASARPSRASLSSKESAPPKAKRPLNTCSIICSVTKLRPVPALTIASMASGSIPALAPMTNLSFPRMSSGVDSRREAKSSHHSDRCLRSCTRSECL